MVKFALEIKAKLNNLTNLQPSGGADNGLPYLFKLTCNKCDTISAKHLCLYITGPDSTNYKCKDCSARGSVRLVPGHGEPFMANGGYTTLMHFDCEGFEPSDYSFSGNWSAQSVIDNEFYEFDFTMGRFSLGEHDDKMKIYKLKSRFETVREQT